jgi:hypothetical protein
MGFFDTVSSILDVATTGYNLYAGIKSTQAASDYSKTLAGSVGLQDTMAKEQWAIQKPLAQKQGKLTGMELDKAIAYEPGILDQQYGLAKNALTSQQADLDLYDDSRGVLTKFFDESMDGLDPGQEMNRAGATVENALSGADNQLARNLARRGVSMDSGQAVSAAHQSAIQKALAKAGARTNAWNQTKATNYARLGNAANVRGGMAADASVPTAPTVNIGNAASTAAGTTAGAANLVQTASQAANAAFADAGYGLNRVY